MKTEKQTARDTETESEMEHEESIVSVLSSEEAAHLIEDHMAVQLLCDLQGSKTALEFLQFLKSAMNVVFRIIHPDRAYLLLADKVTGTLVPKVIQRKESEGRGDGVGVSQTIILKVIEEKKAVLSLDARTDPRFVGSESIQLHSIRSVICVPLTVENRVLGILHVDRKLPHGEFTQDDLILLSAMGHILALAVERFHP
ncbi:MAG: GAF domain-containing protein [Candidatus Omnitrophica bacterium]|nr:GAF domain-containing protein [Candidatus Omnitrophota bacterium]